MAVICSFRLRASYIPSVPAAQQADETGPDRVHSAEREDVCVFCVKFPAFSR